MDPFFYALQQEIADEREAAAMELTYTSEVKDFVEVRMAMNKTRVEYGVKLRELILSYYPQYYSWLELYTTWNMDNCDRMIIIDYFNAMTGIPVNTITVDGACVIYCASMSW